MDNATQWKDIMKDSMYAVIILLIMERLMLTRHGGWLEGAWRCTRASPVAPSSDACRA
jgi:hypothetical protein